MSHTFAPQSLVINMLASEGNMTQGRCYRVVGSYDGYSGCGEQEWCRVADDRGMVIGFDPDRFIQAPAERIPNPVVLSAALRMHRRLKKMIKGMGSSDMLAALHSSLKDQIEDCESVLAYSALDPNADQIVFDQDKDRNYNQPTLWRVVACGSPLAEMTAEAGPEDDRRPVYDLTFKGETRRLEAREFATAFPEVIDILNEDRLGRDFTMWACDTWITKVRDEGVAA